MFFTKTRMKFLSIFAGIFIIAAIMPASPLSLRGARFATTTTFLPTHSSGLKFFAIQRNISGPTARKWSNGT